jgi:hypothetical protein
MKLLVAVTSYFPDAIRGCHQAIRETWGKDLQGIADLKFFTPYPHFADPVEWGMTFSLDSYEPHPDEEWLDMNGLYANISYQVQRILKYSVEHEYDFVHVCANDTFTIPKHLFGSGFEQSDWRGEWYPDKASPFYPLQIGETFDWKWYDLKVPALHGWISGGPGMTFSKKAAEIIVGEDLTPWIAQHDFWGFAYDSLFAQILCPHIKSGLRVTDDARFIWHYPHALGEQRYAGVVQWQKEMYDKYRR